MGVVGGCLSLGWSVPPAEAEVGLVLWPPIRVLGSSMALAQSLWSGGHSYLFGALLWSLEGCAVLCAGRVPASVNLLDLLAGHLASSWQLSRTPDVLCSFQCLLEVSGEDRRDSGPLLSRMSRRPPGVSKPRPCPFPPILTLPPGTPDVGGAALTAVLLMQERVPFLSATLGPFLSFYWGPTCSSSILVILLNSSLFFFFSWRGSKID